MLLLDPPRAEAETHTSELYYLRDLRNVRLIICSALLKRMTLQQLSELHSEHSLASQLRPSVREPPSGPELPAVGERAFGHLPHARRKDDLSDTASRKAILPDCLKPGWKSDTPQVLASPERVTLDSPQSVRQTDALQPALLEDPK